MSNPQGELSLVIGNYSVIKAADSTWIHVYRSNRRLAVIPDGKILELIIAMASEIRDCRQRIKELETFDSIGGIKWALVHTAPNGVETWERTPAAKTAG